MTKGIVITILFLITCSIYLFVQAPPPLPDRDKPVGVTLPIETVFRIVSTENDIIRALWTKEVVGQGRKVGLKFSEDWDDKGVEAGPLPALFLRLASTSLEKNSVRLSLFLGSDFPINPSNLFKGSQQAFFNGIKEDKQPRFFFAEDTQLFTAMFPDFASVQPCISCHNEHPDSPKQNWKLNDIMGATTWAYPKSEVTQDELLDVLGALRKAFREAYSSYLEKASTFTLSPEIGEKWPTDGYFLPSVDQFMQEYTRRASVLTLDY
ncbi:MAG: DUF3365 domain-containing protein, partial [Planctomycetes bacterium]|nr:DUF3365 domain-containing protein [Planctomycetota bacterium]